MVGGFLGEDLYKFGELFREDYRGFCFFCGSGEFCYNFHPLPLYTPYFFLFLLLQLERLFLI